MTARTSRQEETRENTHREYTYTPPSEMEIPEELVEKFSERGFRLRWIRFLEGGEEDYRNIGRKTREGYEFVTFDEVKGYLTMVRETDTKNHRNLVTVGDLALAKIPTYKAEARKRYYEGKNKELEAAVKRELHKSNPKMDRLTPLFDESKSRVQVNKFGSDDSED